MNSIDKIKAAAQKNLDVTENKLDQGYQFADDLALMSTVVLEMAETLDVIYKLEMHPADLRACLASIAAKLTNGGDEK